MDAETLELLRCLQSGPYDESGLRRVRDLLRLQRRTLRVAGQLTTLAEIVHLLEEFAEKAADTRVGSDAIREAAYIAERDLQEPGQAAELRRRAVMHSHGALRESRPLLAAAPVAAVSGKLTSVENSGASASGLDAAIEACERALETEADIGIVRRLADLFAQRKHPGDAEQSADLYCTLGEVLGNPIGIEALERALAQVPNHAEARRLLGEYRATNRVSASPVTAGPVRDSGSRAPRAPRAQVLSMPPAAAGAAPLPHGQANVSSPGVDAALAELPTVAPIRISIDAARSPASGSEAPPLTAAVSSLSPVEVDDAAASFEPKTRGRARRIGYAAAALVAAAAVVVAVIPSTRQRVTQLASGGSVVPSPSAAPSGSGVATRGETATAATSTAPTVQEQEPAAPAAASGDAPAANPVPSEAAVAPTGNAASAAASGEPAKLAESEVHAAAPAPQETGAVATRPAKKPAPVPEVRALLEEANLRGGKLNAAQLAAALEKANEKLERCYADALDKKPRTKGRLSFAWTIRPNGHAAAMKKTGGTIKDATLARCSADVLEATRFPKPKKQAAQVKLTLEYHRS